jgi:hypothetical protein
MRRFSIPFPLLAVAAANTFTVTACTVLAGPFGRGSAAHVTTRDRTARWSGTLAPPATRSGAVPGAGPMQGSAAMRLGPAGWDTYVTVDLANAAPGAVHVWQLRQGRCGQDSGGFGLADAYAPLTVDAQGRAAGAVTVPLLMPTEGRYFVRVSASAADPETIVACANLAAPSRG